MPTPISELITDRELLDFSQHFSVVRPTAGSRFFPDQKTQYIEQEFYRMTENGNLPMSAMVHALDTEAHITSRIPMERVNVEELLIKEKINLTERMQRITRGMSMAANQMRDYIFDDVARMAETVVTRAEKAKMDAIALGKFTIAENGLNFDIDYGIPTENFVSSDWTNADADILGDIRGWRQLAIANGVIPNIAITTEGVVTNMMKNTAIQKAIFGASGTGILPSMEQLNNLMRSQFGFSIETNEARYGQIVTESGKVKVVQHRYFPEDVFVLDATAPNGSLGIGLWGVTPEENEQNGKWDALRQQQYVTVAQWSEKDPVAHWTKASGLFVPVLPNPYGHIIADVSALTLDEMDIDQLKAYAAKHNISLTGKTTKAEILAAIKAAESSEG